MTWVIIAILLVVVIAMFIRFSEPHLIYSLRDSCNRVRMNRLVLDAEEDKDIDPHQFAELMRDDLRIEAPNTTDLYASERVHKIRRLYFMVQHDPEPERVLRACVAEIAELLNGVSRRLSASGAADRDFATAPVILGFLAHRVRNPQQPMVEIPTGADLERWYAERPMSMEQAMELAIAAILGLAYRSNVTAGSVNGGR